MTSGVIGTLKLARAGAVAALLHLPR